MKPQQELPPAGTKKPRPQIDELEAFDDYMTVCELQGRAPAYSCIEEWRDAV